MTTLIVLTSGLDRYSSFTFSKINLIISIRSVRICATPHVKLKVLVAIGGRYRSKMNRRNVIILMAFWALISLTGFAQPLQNQKEAKVYFTDHIQQLDPIEGIYDVENTMVIYSAYAGRESFEQHYACAIHKGLNDLYAIYSFEGDTKGLIGIVEKMSGPKSYSIKKVGANGKLKKIHFQLNDLFSFELTEEDSNRSAKCIVSTKFIKKYPTIDMYAELEQAEKNRKHAQWSGTGFFLSKDGYVITNHHVVENARTIKVSGINSDTKTSYNARVEISDKQNDLAILKITDASFKPLTNIPYTFKYTTSSVGEDCYVLGYPLISTMGLDIKLTNGIISSKTGFEGNIAEYQMSAPVQPGNSGGPLFDKNGNIIGVVCAKHREAENAGYAIKASYIRNLVELLPTSINWPQTNLLTGKSLPEQVELASKAVCVIIMNDD